MITILKSVTVGSENKISNVQFTFLFDIKSELPKDSYQVGGKTYIIAEDSIAVSNNTKTVYKYTDNSWIKTTNKYSGNLTPISNITASGTYSFGDNYSEGMNNIMVAENINGGGEVPTLPMRYIHLNGSYYHIDNCVYPYKADGIYDVKIMNNEDSLKNLKNSTGNNALIISPVKRINVSSQVPAGYITFTPDEEFDGIYVDGNKVTLEGDTIVPGDNNLYLYTMVLMSSTPHTIQKIEAPANFTIN